MTVQYDICKKTIIEIKVPHSIYNLFEYEDQYDYKITNVHYGMYQLSILIQDMEDEEWDITSEDRDFIYEVYKLCEKLFNENDLVEIYFLDEEYD